MMPLGGGFPEGPSTLNPKPSETEGVSVLAFRSFGFQVAGLLLIWLTLRAPLRVLRCGASGSIYPNCIYFVLEATYIYYLGQVY